MANWEHGIDSHGSEVDSLGIPYNETFTQQEIRRLGFEVYRLALHDDELVKSDMTPDDDKTPVPKRPIKSFGSLRYRA